MGERIERMISGNDPNFTDVDIYPYCDGRYPHLMHALSNNNQMTDLNIMFVRRRMDPDLRSLVHCLSARVSLKKVVILYGDLRDVPDVDRCLRGLAGNSSIEYLTLDYTCMSYQYLTLLLTSQGSNIKALVLQSVHLVSSDGFGMDELATAFRENKSLQCLTLNNDKYNEFFVHCYHEWPFRQFQT